MTPGPYRWRCDAARQVAKFDAVAVACRKAMRALGAGYQQRGGAPRG